MRMKKSAAFRLFHEHSDNCEALSELRSSEFARAIVNMRRSEKRNATFFSPYFFRFFEHSPYTGGEKEMQRFSAHTSFDFLSTCHIRSRKLFFYNSAFHYEFISRNAVTIHFLKSFIKVLMEEVFFCKRFYFII